MTSILDICMDWINQFFQDAEIEDRNIHVEHPEHVESVMREIRDSYDEETLFETGDLDSQEALDLYNMGMGH